MKKLNSKWRKYDFENLTEDEKLRIIPCEKCFGTGLEGVYKLSDGSFACSQVPIEDCHECNGLGILDWIDVLTKKRKK